MQIHGISQTYSIKHPIVTVGTFDGVHRGHRKILERLKQLADEQNGESVVLTLYPHPRKVLNPDTKLNLLNSLEEKQKLLDDFGIDHLIIYPFNLEFASLTSCEFIEQILHKKIGTKKLIVGYDHRFGKDRQGDTTYLKQCSLNFGFNIERIDALTINNVIISSTKIRQALENGKPRLAADYLTYDYELTGTVIHGQQIGRALGFPTANLKLNYEDKLIPKSGVYFVEAEHTEKGTFSGMMNIGTKPTIEHSKNQTIELHLFNFQDMIYGDNLKVRLKSYLRPEIKFENLNALKSQLEKDKSACLSLQKG